MTSVFAVTLSTRTPLPEPPAGETVSHDGASLMTVQVTLEVTATLVAFAVGPGAQVDEPKVRIGADTPSCVTMIVLVRPPHVTVMVPVRLDAPVFSNASMSNVPSFNPLLGVTISQDEVPFVTVHDILETTDTLI